MRLRKLWKCLAALTVGFCAEPSAGQFPGGDRGSRGDRGSQGGSPPSSSRGGFSADSSFDRLIQSYGGTGDAVDYARIPPETRERTNGFAMRFGVEPMPVSGIITRAQYSEQFNARMETIRAKMGQPSGAPPGAPPAMPTAPGAIPTAPGIPATQAEMTDEQLLMAMRQLDRDGDNRISIQEASQSGRMSRVFQTYDKNSDGFIDLAEFKVYMSDRMNNRIPSSDRDNNSQPQPYGQQPYSQPNASYGTVSPAPEEQRPVVLRYGKMPKELPSWFTELDTDKDGQIGMYEWRFDSRPVADFLAMDLNGDGLLTAEEYLRFKNPTVAMSAGSGGSESRTVSTGGSGGNPFNRNSTGGNPFNRNSTGGGKATSDDTGGDNKDKKDRKDRGRSEK